MFEKRLYAAHFKELTRSESRSKDVKIWCQISRIIGENSLFVDRTSKIPSPFRIEVSGLCQLPQTVENFKKAYRDLCDERAIELLKRQDSNGKLISLFYSGGIDSTLVVVSFLRNLAPSEVKDRIRIYMTPRSIAENPEFYRKYIRPQFRLESAEKIVSVLDGKSVFVGAEFNDHIFGNYLTQTLTLAYGSGFKEIQYSPDLINKIFQAQGLTPEGADFWSEQIHSSIANQNLTEVKSLVDFMWWFNFIYRWQATFFSIILRVLPPYRSMMSERFLSENYQHFFMTEDFQKWALINHESKIGKDWKSYKWPAKQVIFEFNGDENYRDNKIKAPSLNYLLTQRYTARAINNRFEFLDQFSSEDYLIN